MAEIRTIRIHTIAHADQRYPTVGDWRVNGDMLLITVSDCGDWRANLCVAMHELTEAILCCDRNITHEQVDDFDMREGRFFDEPGDEPAAPYHREHMAANVVERFMQAQFMMSDAEYEKKLAKLDAAEMSKGEAHVVVR